MEKTTKAKVENYTAAQTAELKTAYAANPEKATIETFAAKFGKTTRSIVAKLSREGVYKKAEYVAKTGEKPIAKELLADKICSFAGIPANLADSIAKANKQALVGILSRFNVMAARISELENAGS